MRRPYSILLALVLISPALSAQSDPGKIVEDFVEAFSGHDVPAMLAFVHADIEWLLVDGSTVAVETSGRDALEWAMTAYFTSCPSCTSTVRILGVNGAYVSAIETAEWQTSKGSRAQSSLSVYEIVDGLIRRVWYYPAVAP